MPSRFIQLFFLLCAVTENGGAYSQVSDFEGPFSSGPAKYLASFSSEGQLFLEPVSEAALLVDKSLFAAQANAYEVTYSAIGPGRIYEASPSEEALIYRMECAYGGSESCAALGVGGGPPADRMVDSLGLDYYSSVTTPFGELAFNRRVPNPLLLDVAPIYKSRATNAVVEGFLYSDVGLTSEALAQEQDRILSWKSSGLSLVADPMVEFFKLKPYESSATLKSDFESVTEDFSGLRIAQKSELSGSEVVLAEFGVDTIAGMSVGRMREIARQAAQEMFSSAALSACEASPRPREITPSLAVSFNIFAGAEFQISAVFFVEDICDAL